MFWFGQMLITNFPHRRKKCFLNIQTIQCYVWNSTLILKRRWLPLGGDAMLQSFAQITLFILDVWNIKWQCRKWIWPQYMYIYILCIFNPNYQFLIKMKILKNVRIFFFNIWSQEFWKRPNLGSCQNLRPEQNLRPCQIRSHKWGQSNFETRPGQTRF